MAIMRTDSAVMTRNFAESSAHYLLVHDYASLETFLLNSAELPDVRRLQVAERDGVLIWDVARLADGRLSATTGVARIATPATATTLDTVEEDRLVIWQPIAAGSVLGWLKAEFSLTSIRQAQARTWENTLALAAIWMFLSAGLIVLVLRPVVRSIGELTAFAKQLDQRKGAQISVRRQPLEIVELGKSLNEASLKLLSTERQLIDERERLRASETLHRSVVTAMAEGMRLQAASGEIKAVNPAAERIEGRSADQMLGRIPSDPQWRAIHEDGSPFLCESHPSMVTLRSGEPQRDVVMGIHKPDGTLTWISVNSQPLTAENEQLPYEVITTFRDITERKTAEALLRRLNRELRTISECNRAMMRAEHEQDLLGEICRIVCELAGYRMAWVGFAGSDEARSVRPLAWAGAEDGYLEQVRMTWADTEHGHGPSGCAIRSGASACIQDYATEPQAEPWREYALQRGYRSSVALPLKDEDAHTFGVLNIYSAEPNVFTADEIRLLEELAGDLSFGIMVQRARIERRNADEQIHMMNAELEQRVEERTAQLETANRELEAFAYSVSHDLRAPLRHISGFLGMLEERIATMLDADSRRYVERISNAAKRMGMMIDDLLSFSRMGRSEMERKQVDLAVLMREVAEDLAPETAGRNVRWEIAQLPAAIGDRAMLRLVLTNLVANALKFTRTRAQAVVEIGCQLGESEETVIYVRDNGVGFDMRYADKLFGVFQRLHRDDQFEGTGIGLANVRRIITRLGGRTWAEAEVDRGATFYFSLPRVARQG